MAAHGVSGDRLVWGDVKAAAAHLRRAEAAALFLDTVAYNGHTSAADALWAGVPVYTLTPALLSAHDPSSRSMDVSCGSQ
jgi:predicted O-linked N-acetylglucosamine transferase (SPINDLY family)